MAKVILRRDAVVEDLQNAPEGVVILVRKNGGPCQKETSDALPLLSVGDIPA